MGIDVPGRFCTLIPVLGTALVLLYAQAGTVAAQFLSLRFMVGIGLISYSAYLWHHPLFAFARIASHTEPHPLLMTALIGATLGLAYLSWRFVEQPFRRKERRVLGRRRALFAASFAAGAAFFAFGFVGDQNDGFVWRYYSPQQQAFIEDQRDGRHPEIGIRDCFVDTEIVGATLAPQFNPVPKCCFGATLTPPHWLSEPDWRDAGHAESGCTHSQDRGSGRYAAMGPQLA